MTDEQMRIAIADACGWKKPDDPEVMKFKVGWTSAEKWWMCPGGVLRLKHDIPDYLNDLNACAEFEAMLTSAERFTYIVELNKLCGDEPSAVWATARQRAEAFLKTKKILP